MGIDLRTAGSFGGTALTGAKAASGYTGWGWAAKAADMAWQYYTNRRQMRFNKRMSDTAWRRGVADMQSAGLNPALAYGQGGASSPTTSLKSPGEMGSAMELRNQMLQTAADVKLKQATGYNAAMTGSMNEANALRAWQNQVKEKYIIEKTLDDQVAMVAAQLRKERMTANAAEAQAKSTLTTQEINSFERDYLRYLRKGGDWIWAAKALGDVVNKVPSIGFGAIFGGKGRFSKSPYRPGRRSSTHNPAGNPWGKGREGKKFWLGD